MINIRFRSLSPKYKRQPPYNDWKWCHNFAQPLPTNWFSVYSAVFLRRDSRENSYPSWHFIISMLWTKYGKQNVLRSISQLSYLRGEENESSPDWTIPAGIRNEFLRRFYYYRAGYDGLTTTNFVRFMYSSRMKNCLFWNTVIISDIVFIVQYMIRDFWNSELYCICNQIIFIKRWILRKILFITNYKYEWNSHWERAKWIIAKWDREG